VTGGEGYVIEHSRSNIPPNSDFMAFDSIDLGECPDSPLNYDRCDLFAQVDSLATTVQCQKTGKIGAVCEFDESNNMLGGTIGGCCGDY
jgi:hypothetical protein